MKNIFVDFAMKILQKNKIDGGMKNIDVLRTKM